MSESDKELREAAEWLARHPMLVRDCKHLWNAHNQCQWCRSMRRDVYVALVSDWAVAELARRDAEQVERAKPITKEALRERGFVDCAVLHVVFLRIGATEIRVAKYDMTVFLTIYDTDISNRLPFKTIGQLDDLIAALKGSAK